MSRVTAVRGGSPGRHEGEAPKTPRPTLVVHNNAAPALRLAILTLLARKRQAEFDALNPYSPAVRGWQTYRRQLQRDGLLPAEEHMWKNSHALHLEIKSLKKKLDATERENRELKQSLYELTAKHSAALIQLGRIEASEVESFQDAAEITQHSTQRIMHEAEMHAQREAEFKHRVECKKAGAAEDTAAMQFYYKYDLCGHSGAVYTVRFSPSGRLLASCSFDRTVRCWDIEKPLQQEETLCLQEHTHNVTDLSWSADSSLLLSCGYRQFFSFWRS